MNKILVVDDNVEIGELICEFGHIKNYDISYCDNPLTAIDLCNSNVYDLLVLDISMPIMDGFELYERLNVDTPIIFLSARGSEDDKIRGLSLGAWDYLVKPFSMRELFIKIDFIIARTKNIFNYGAYVFNTDEKTCMYNGYKLNLTRYAFDLLYILVSNPGNIYTRSDLLRLVWGVNYEIASRTVDSHILMIRNELNNNDIKTVRAKGYYYEE